ncbi:MAG TPA: ribosome recycling factor [Candidatus Avidehalobacter gallistercoris]|uniref:Ribosome-recycling factor n=1 Tax=Candidatus Avidehalobacter gallistercoris TaxID=2840694 RepID=A0A9D1HIH9_9FIRM|nr:ribosome recycling factor [Candidatus Avidehalobacter gallistercoris]
MPSKEILQTAEEKMQKAYDAMCQDFAVMRAGRADPAILDKIMVDYYGTPTPIAQMASISVPEARLLAVQPWDRSMIKAIEKAIQTSDLGINPTNDGQIIRLAIPPLTEERRKELVKSCDKRAEEAKVSVRNIRRDVNDKLKALEKKSEASEDEVKNALDKSQKQTDDFIKKIDETLKKKEKDILSV